MEVVCAGLSYRSAPLEVRERLALSGEAQDLLLGQLRDQGLEAVVLCTCNRAEIYAAGPAAAEALEAARAALCERGGAQAQPHLYEHGGEAAVLHLFRVCCSLDSMVLGEAQIFGQVKDAYERAQTAGSAGGELSRACQAAFACAKRARTETGIGRAATSMASAAVDLSRRIFGDLHGRPALVVGAGEIGELAARHLSQARCKVVIANRTRERAEALAAQVGAAVRPFEELHALLHSVDLVVSSTASPAPLFTRENVVPAMKARRHRPLLLVDLAVPRDVAPGVHGSAEGVYAYDVDDIRQVIDENVAARANEAAKAEQIVAEEVARYVRARAVRDGVPVLAQLRQRAEQIARAEAERTLQHLPELSEKQRKSVEAMGMAIVNKLLHQPTAKLRALDPSGQPSPLADAAAELFGLEEAPPKAAGGKS
ncbi:MAG TPA: glutamyl-tRNA reductase [Myxococcaceae bacterium]|nr:glutamyl-tRNA reductase [Myxococcaceae bacterium]